MLLRNLQEIKNFKLLLQGGTKRMMKNEKAKILMYGLTAGQENLVQERHGAAYEIVKTDCFTDILAIPAEMVVVNPKKMSVTEQKQMNEVFQHDNFTLILFTNEFDKEVMPNLKYWARFEDYMNRAAIEGNSFAYVKKLCAARLAAYFPAGVPAFVNERYRQELEYIEECGGAGHAMEKSSGPLFPFFCSSGRS